MFSKIQKTGGDALLRKFLTDPEMLEPNIVQGFLGDGGANPYEGLLKKTHSTPANTPSSPYSTQQMGADLNQTIGQYYTPEGIKNRTPQNEQQLVQAVMARRAQQQREQQFIY